MNSSTTCVSPSKSAHIFLKSDAQSNPAHSSSQADIAAIATRGSVTLGSVMEQYNISSVLECDATGCLNPRAVVIDSPSDVLHSGHHYVARKHAAAILHEADVTAKDSGRVHFLKRVAVKEFMLPNSFGGGEEISSQCEAGSRCSSKKATQHGAKKKLFFKSFQLAGRSGVSELITLNELLATLKRREIAACGEGERHQACVSILDAAKAFLKSLD